jgi:hypothetical protein
MKKSNLQAWSIEDAAKETLRTALRRTVRDLENAKVSREELVAAVYNAAKDATAAMEIKPVPPAKKDIRQKHEEVAIAVLSDWQLSKKTPTYNSDICQKRIERYAEKVITITRIQRADHPVKNLRVYLLGDIVEGEMIFPGQAHLIDASLYSQVVERGPEILSGFLRSMAAEFEHVHVVSVVGNHGALGGRSRKDYHPESNADAMLSEVTRLILKPEEAAGRITWAPNVLRGERRWYAVDRIGDKGYMLFHGDQVKGGFAGWPWYGFAKKIMGWRMGAIQEPFDYSLSGHFHTPVRMLVGGITHWGNGSTESTNTYAAEQLAAQGTPSQWLLYSHLKRGVSAEYEIHL